MSEIIRTHFEQISFELEDYGGVGIITLNQKQIHVYKKDEISSHKFKKIIYNNIQSRNYDYNVEFEKSNSNLGDVYAIIKL